MTKINIFSGFLGAGKTTLIKKMIAETFHEKTVLIENEFGDISVDGGFLKEAGIEMKEINSGCICCSLVGDFEASLREVIDKFQPQRILIEPSGVGKLSDVKKAVSLVCDDETVIDGGITVVHAGKCKMYARNFGEFFADQVASADLIVFSRTQSLSEEKMAEAVAVIKNLNQTAPIVTTPWDEISGDKIIAALKNSELLPLDAVDGQANHHHHGHECHHDHRHAHHHQDHDHECCHGHEHEHDHEHGHHRHECDDPDCHCHDHHADEVFTSWGRETAAKYTKARLEEIVGALDDAAKYGTVLRAKGILANADGKEWLHFNYVPGEGTVEFGPADYTGRFCVIGSNLNETALAELFEI